MTDELALRVEAVYLRALLAVADKLADTIESLRARRDQIDERLATAKEGAKP